MKDAQDPWSVDGGGTDAVNDLDRRLVDERLQRFVGTGRLALEDYERRAGAVWGASTRSELAVVTADLPVAVRAGVDGQRSRPPSRGRLSLRLGLAAASIALVGSGLVGAVVLSGASEGRATLLVEDGTAAFDVGTRAETVTVVVPDGARLDLTGLDVQGDAYCDGACTASSGPPVRLVGTLLKDVHIVSQDEWDSGQDSSTVVVG